MHSQPVVKSVIMLSVFSSLSALGMTKRSYVDAVLKGIDDAIHDCQSLIYVRYYRRGCVHCCGGLYVNLTIPAFNNKVYC